MAREKNDAPALREAAVGHGETEVSASELKDWHQWLQRVAEGGQSLIVIRYGNPIARLSPVGSEVSEKRLFGAMAGSVTCSEDLMSPTGESWDAEG